MIEASYIALLQMLRLLGHLQPAAAHAGALLLRHACLTVTQPQASGSGGAGAGGSAAADPTGRGELLLSSLIAVGEPHDTGSRSECSSAQCDFLSILYCTWML